MLLFSLTLDVCQRFIRPCDRSSTFGQLFSGESCPGLWSKAWREKHSGFGFALLVIYGEDPSILLCSAGRGNAGGNSGKWRISTRQQPPLKTCWWTGSTASASGFRIQCSRVHSHTHTHLNMRKKHTVKTNMIWRGIPDLCLHLRLYHSPFCCKTTARCQVTYFKLLLAALYTSPFSSSSFI